MADKATESLAAEGFLKVLDMVYILTASTLVTELLAKEVFLRHVISRDNPSLFLEECRQSFMNVLSEAVKGEEWESQSIEKATKMFDSMVKSIKKVGTADSWIIDSSDLVQ
jgi:hypothetical protein